MKRKGEDETTKKIIAVVITLFILHLVVSGIKGLVVERESRIPNPEIVLNQDTE